MSLIRKEGSAKRSEGFGGWDVFQHWGEEAEMTLVISPLPTTHKPLL